MGGVNRGKGIRKGVHTDEAGAMLLLAGLLLVLGTVTIGATFLQLNALPEDALRHAGSASEDPLSDFVAGLNESVRGHVARGTTNLTDLNVILQDVERQLEARAAGSGIFATAELDPDPDPELFRASGRCASYDADRSRLGLIVGYDLESRQEMVVGAVYDVHASDGLRTLRFPYYVKIADCLAQNTTSWFTAFDVYWGSASGASAARNANDDGGYMALREGSLGTANVLTDAPPDTAGITYNGWNNPTRVGQNDSAVATHPATPLNDFLRFPVDTSTLPAATKLWNMQVFVDSWGEDINDDYLELRVIHEPDVLYTFTVPTPGAETTHVFDIATGPSGATYWTTEELAATRFEFRVIEVDGFDPPSFFHVDHAVVDFNYTETLGHTVDVRFDFPWLPPVFDVHHLNLRYALDSAGTPEDFLLQIWDGSQWNTRLVLAPTGGAFAEANYTLIAADIAEGYVSARIIDAEASDTSAAHADELRLDWIRLWSDFV